MAFRRVGEQEMHVCCIRMAIWGWSGAISEGWRAGNACIVHEKGHSGLVGCHFGGSSWLGQWLKGLAFRIAETTRIPASGNHHTFSRHRRLYVQINFIFGRLANYSSVTSYKYWSVRRLMHNYSFSEPEYARGINHKFHGVLINGVSQNGHTPK